MIGIRVNTKCKLLQGNRNPYDSFVEILRPKLNKHKIQKKNIIKYITYISKIIAEIKKNPKR